MTDQRPTQDLIRGWLERNALDAHSGRDGKVFWRVSEADIVQLGKFIDWERGDHSNPYDRKPDKPNPWATAERIAEAMQDVGHRHTAQSPYADSALRQHLVRGHGRSNDRIKWIDHATLREEHRRLHAGDDE